MKTKLTKIQTRARNYCNDLLQRGGMTINVEWRKSSSYGRCPVIEYGREKIAYASGCGYDKLSAALVEALSFLLPETEETGCGGGLSKCSGAGLSSVQTCLQENGWTLEQTANGKTFDAFKLSRA